MIYTDVRERLLQGATKLSDVVSSTMGPKGRNVIINRLSDDPSITKDGVTVARNVYLKDVVENIAVRLVKEAAMNVVKEAGDGTTTATLLTSKFFKEGNMLEAEGYSPNHIRSEFGKLKDMILTDLKANRILITDENRDLLRKVATISANNDQELGSVIYDAVEMVGFDGAVKVLASRNSKTYVEKIDGVEYKNGYLSPYFVNNSSNRKTEFHKPVAVYLFDKKLESMNEIEAILKLNYSNPVLFICADYSPEATSMLIINKQRGRELCAVRAAEFGDYRKAVFEDLALMTGATVVDALKPFLSDRDANAYKGAVDGCIITSKDHTLFLNKKIFNTPAKDRHVEILKELHANTTIEFDKDKTKDRISKLTTGVANIYVGARTEVELGEKVDRVDDALLATHAALEEGVVVGSGLALVKAYHNILCKIESEESTDDFQYEILDAFQSVMDSCFTKICENAYIDDIHISDLIQVLTSALHQNSTPFLGYDLSSFDVNDVHELQPIDLLDKGVIDPFKVTRVALENAFSIAMMLLTVDNVVEHFDIDNPYLPSIEQ